MTQVNKKAKTSPIGCNWVFTWNNYNDKKAPQAWPDMAQLVYQCEICPETKNTTQPGPYKDHHHNNYLIQLHAMTASCNDSRRQAKLKSRFIGDITACNAKSVGLPEPVLSVRIGRPQWSPPLSRCLQRRRDSELEGLTNSGSFMQ